MRHNVIVVASWNDELLSEAHKVAADTFPWVSPVSPKAMNSVASFFIPPDGSKEGWADSELGDDRRDAYTKWLETKRYDDGSTSLDWAEIQFGDDNHETKIVRDSDEAMRAK